MQSRMWEAGRAYATCRRLILTVEGWKRLGPMGFGCIGDETGWIASQRIIVIIMILLRSHQAEPKDVTGLIATPSISFGTSPPGLPRRNIHLSFYHIPIGVILHRGKQYYLSTDLTATGQSPHNRRRGNKPILLRRYLVDSATESSECSESRAETMICHGPMADRSPDWESSEQLIRWVWGSLIHGTADADGRLLLFAINNHYGNTRTPSVAFTCRDPFRGSKTSHQSGLQGCLDCDGCELGSEEGLVGCTRISRIETHRRDAPNGNGPTVETGVWSGASWLRILSCVVRNDLPPEGIETERKEEKQFRYLTHGKVRGLHAALSLNGGGATDGSWVMMTAMMLMATDNRQATTNERAEHSEERAPPTRINHCPVARVKEGAGG
ncbi:hypothetical protein An15g03120 [Aspergillus niger]|uniref:Uncharacterized protein n=2 Tax=Aspergillus niger TaxID=5061 RepID=A2R592_ASPNC|nr:hypothetical protein An15g03120 [Aspergillus niger]CAK42387.1 hypothetical protein An15g03120 [Aspergillus niger]